MPAMSSMTEQPQDPSSVGWLNLPPMRYPNEYVWFLLFSTMDVMLTWVILTQGGTEVNPVAALVIGHWGLPGAIAFKFRLMLVVVLACEAIGRKIDRAARNLAQAAVVISAMPVMFSLALLLVHVWRPATS